MIGAILGDIVGSPHEYSATKAKDFPLLTIDSAPTDDSYLTLAVAQCLLDGTDYVPAFHAMVARYPRAGWGGNFAVWGRSKSAAPYNSFGNGSAMRVSPVGFAFESESDVLREAERSAAVTHNHSEGIKGAQATALAIFLARQGAAKDEIRSRVARFSGYNLSRTVDEIRPAYSFNELCQTTVPEALAAFLDSTSVEDAIRNAISLGGDADTLAAIAGPIAQAHYRGVNEEHREAVRLRLPADLWSIVERFEKKFGAY
jgi:ADP-ribosylglycohydrolase